MTHSYAVLNVKPETFDEIRRLLLDAGYHHMMVNGLIDMTGIAVGVEPVFAPALIGEPEICPRRTHEHVGAPEDGWTMRGSERRCTYCGSLHPDDVLARIAAGDEVGPTDKNYKMYLLDGAGKFYFQHFSETQARRFIELFNNHTMRVGAPGLFYVRPFFMRSLDNDTQTAFRTFEGESGAG